MIFSTNKDPKICYKHGFKSYVGYEENGLIKFRHECKICSNIETRKVLFEKTQKKLFPLNLIEQRERILEFWSRSGLLEGLQEPKRTNIAMILEAQSQQKII